MGDPGGIGPELLLKSLWRLHRENRLSLPIRIFGSARHLRFISEKLNIPSIEEFPGVELIDPEPAGGPFPLGRFSEEGGRAQVAFLREAFRSLKNGEIGAIATGPINKRALQLSGLPYRGHTDWLRALFQTEVAMLLSTPELSVVPITAHIPLRRVAEEITAEKIVTQTLAAVRTLKKIYSLGEVPTAVCGLNPHAGEGGLLGDEDLRIVAPAVEKLRALGLSAEGPLPADSLFAEKNRRRYLLIVGMYHDQVLTPIKALFFNKVINITAGLPTLRTSPDHGVAYQLAGTGKADSFSFYRAIDTALHYLAADLSKNSAATARKKM